MLEPTPSPLDGSLLIRPGTARDGDRVAEIFLAARAGMTYLPSLYTDDEVRWWVREVMVPHSEFWIAERDGVPVGFAALNGPTLEHLYVNPSAQGGGAGTALLEQVKRSRPRMVDLRVFQQNTGARAFYARHGFSIVSESDGSDNEERLPDLQLRWQPTGS